MTPTLHALRPSRGFTLIELMVTLAVAAVLMMVAVPSLTTFKRNAELTSATNTLLASINAARGEAMKRGRSAMVVANGSSWSSGWTVFVDTVATQSYTDADFTVLVQPALTNFTVTGTPGSTATGATPYLLFDASGYSKTKTGGFNALTLSITPNFTSDAQLADQTRRVVVAATGRARTCKPASASDTSCSATSTQ